MVLEEPRCSSVVMQGSNPASSEGTQGCPGLWGQLKRGQDLLSAPAPPRGSEPAAAPPWHRRLREEMLRSPPQSSAGARGFNCTLGILVGSSPGIIYKNRKREKQGERKNIKGLLNFHAACEQGAFFGSDHSPVPLGGRGAQLHQHRANGGLRAKSCAWSSAGSGAGLTAFCKAVEA